MHAPAVMSSQASTCSSRCVATVKVPRQAASSSIVTTTSSTTTIPKLRRQLKLVAAFASSPSTPPAASVGGDGGEKEEEIEEIPADELLLPEEDWTVPGGANDSLTSNTPLGRAVGGACDELEALAELERDAALQAANLLKKLGYRGTLLDNPPPLPEKKSKKSEEEE